MGNFWLVNVTNQNVFVYLLMIMAVIMLVPCIIRRTQKALEVTVKKIFVMQLTQIEQMFLRKR